MSIRRLCLAIIQGAGVLVPDELRAEWFAEWRSELWYVSQPGVDARTVRFCIGAFADALWLRQNGAGPRARKLFRFASPFHCVLFLAVLAAVSLFFAFQFPAPFAMLGFYRTVSMSVPGGRTAELSIALASNNLFELPGIRVPPQDAALILNRTAWRKYFDGDPHIGGKVLQIAGQHIRVAGVISADAWRLPGRIDAWLLLPPHANGFVAPHPGQVIFAHLLILALAVLILPATTSLPLGKYPDGGHRTPWTKRARRWIFLGIKFALILPIVFCGTLDLAPLISATGIQPHATLVGYIMAFRWALIDQRERCPVCLRLLINPTRIGCPSQTFLEWYGTELICDRGHGLLHVTEIPTSCYGTQRWLHLDPSWRSLFS